MPPERTSYAKALCSLLDGVLVHLNERAKTAVAGAKGLDRVDVDLLCRQFRQNFSDCTRMVFTGDVECRLLLSEFDLELLCGLLEERRVFRNHIDPGLAFANRVAPNADEIYAGLFEGG